MRNLRHERAPRPGSALCEQPVTSKFRHVLRVLTAFVVIALVCSFLNRNAFDYLELYAYNMRMAIRSARDRAAVESARRKIVLVTLSDESFTGGVLPRVHPLPRNCHAKIVRDLTRAGAKAIVFDLIFLDPGPHDGELASAARSSGRVIWACLPQGKDDSGTEQMAQPNDRLIRACSRVGHCLVVQGLDLPVSDRVQGVVIFDGRRIPSLSLQAAALACGSGSEPIPNAFGTGLRMGRLRIPLDRSGCFRISYLGKPSETFASIPYEQIYAGAVDDEFYRANHFFRDKIVLVGDATTTSKDRLYTPVGEMSGVEIHAHAIATVLQQRFVIEVAPWVNIAAVCLLAGIVCVLAAGGNPYRIALGTVAVLVVYFLGNVWLFSERGLWMQLAAPTVAAVACAGCMLGEHALTAELDKKRMRWLLHRYVSPELADYIIANPDACVPGGKRVEATVMFADIRDFARMSEGLSPEGVVRVLNSYFDSMTSVAFKHGGTVDKFVGDAIMVLFGVPVPYEDHVHRAVSAAIDMQSMLLGLQREWSASGGPVIDISIGINSGVMVAGSIGSTQRLDYTVIGDDVNTAARVTDLNSQLNTRILATQSTYEVVKDEVAARGPLTGAVKGKELIAYEIIGWKEASPAGS